MTAVLIFVVLPLATDRFRRRLGLLDALPAPRRVARLQPGTDEALRRGIKRAASIGIGLYLTGAVLATSLQLYAGRNSGEPLPSVILTNPPLTLPAGTHWGVALQATPLKNAVFTHRYAVRVAQYKDFYTPLVPTNWTPADKIELMEKDSASVGEHDVWDEPVPPGPIRGYFRTGGPAPWIQRLYRQAGYQVGPWTVIVERSDIGPEIPAPNSDNAFFILYMFGVTGSVFMIGALIAYRRLRALTK